MVVAIKEDVTDQAFKTVESKDDWFVGCEIGVKGFVAQAARIHIRMAQFQQVHDVDETDLQCREPQVEAQSITFRPSFTNTSASSAE